MITILALTALVAQPYIVENSAQLSRTMIPRGFPAGEGCLTAASSGATAVLFTDSSNVLPTPIPLKSQIWVTNNSTASATYCFTQDPAPTISRVGRFSADSDSYYSAGYGNCFILGPGSWPIMAIKEIFIGGSAAAARTPGARGSTCSNSVRPCAASAECTGNATCTVPGTTHTYLAAIHRAGADNDSNACIAK